MAYASKPDTLVSTFGWILDPRVDHWLPSSTPKPFREAIQRSTEAGLVI